jgi:hypothetical protein
MSLELQLELIPPEISAEALREWLALPFRDQRACSRWSVMSRLNTLRGPVAHCTPLAEDEVLRLRLSVRDWFRLME